MEIAPFKVDWQPEAIEALKAKVREFPHPAAPRDAGWAYGCDADYLKRLCDYWVDGYDWKAAQATLNAYPQFLATVEDQQIHYVHVVGEAGGRRPLLMTHGWPGSHYEFWGVIEQLAFPSRFGGQAGDAFDIVAPSLPGFGFSGKPDRLVGQQETARLFDTLMRDGLGYDHYLAQGGDWGGMVTSFLGLNHPESLRGIHLNMIGLQPTLGPQSEAERAWVARAKGMGASLSAYQQLQATKPQSIAWAMAGNPVGQAAWIAERFHDWADLRTRPFEAVFSMDHLLTNISIYVMNDAFTTAAWYYRARVEEGWGRLPGGVRCEVPTAFANFHGEPLYNPPPRSWAERAYSIARWRDYDEGGHFAAMEQPATFCADLQAWGRGEA